jgi:ABC-2 type transport system permease protein
MLNRIVALIWKELLAVLRDPRSRRAITIPPIIQLVVFVFAATLDVINVPIGILNRDNGEQGFEFVQRFHGAPTFGHIIYLKSVDEIASFIDNQRGVMVVHLDENFSKNLDANKPADVQLILDGRKSNTAQVVAGYTNSIINQFNIDFAAKVNLQQQNTQLFPYNWFNPNLIYPWYNVPSLLAILAMLTALTVTSASVARERELGTFDQLLVSPLQPLEILIGKMIPGIIIGVAESTIILIVGVLVFQVPFQGSLPLLYLSLGIFVTCIVGVGLFISSLCSTQQQASLGTFTFMVPSVLLAGFATPIENMPTWLQPVTYFFPLRYMLVISKGIYLKAMPAAIVFDNIWPMVLIAIFTTSCATWLFRRRLE